MNTVCSTRPVLPVDVGTHKLRPSGWRQALAQAVQRWREQAQAQALRRSMAGLGAQTLRDVGLAELVAPRREVTSLLDWQRGHW